MDSNKLKQTNEKYSTPKQRFVFVLGVFFFAIYFVMGVSLVFWKEFPLELSNTNRVLFGIALIVYAFFRFVRLLKNR